MTLTEIKKIKKEALTSVYKEFPFLIKSKKSTKQVIVWLPHQEEILRETADGIVVVGGYGSGKTLVAIKKFLSWVEKSTAPSIITGFSFNTVIKLIEDTFQKLLIPFKFNSQTNTLTYKGHKIYVYGMDTKRSKERIRSLNAQYWYADEVVLQDKEACKEVLARLREGGDNKFIWTTNPDEPSHWVKTEYIDSKEYKTYEINSHQNPYLGKNTEDYIRKLGYPKGTASYNRYILGQWVINDDRPFKNVRVLDLKPKEDDTIVVCIDPSLKGNDFTAVAVGFISNGRIVITGKLWGADWYECFDDMFEYIDNTRCDYVYVEDNIVGNAFKQHAERNYNLPITNFHSKENKQRRIMSLLPFVADGTIVFSKDIDPLFKKQCEEYHVNTKEHDDAPDCVHMCYNILKDYL